jgi:hypothetical protein
MSEKIKELLHQSHEFIANISKINAFSAEYSIFSSCVFSSLAKSYEFLVYSHADLHSDGLFFSASTLRGIAEDLITLKFISTLEYEKRDKVVLILQLIELKEKLKNQQAFFDKYRPFQPVLQNPPSTASAEVLKKLKIEKHKIWCEAGWPNLRKYKNPPTREIATKLAPGALDLLYDFIYRLTSSTVHFSPQMLLRLGWGLIDAEGKKFSGHYSTKNMMPYYKKFCQIYGALLLCLYFEFFGEYLSLTPEIRKIVFSIRTEIILDNRWPEMVTFEEINQPVPQIYSEYPVLYSEMHAQVVERFRDGFIVKG